MDGKAGSSGKLGNDGIPGSENPGNAGNEIEAEIAGTANEGNAGKVGSAGSSGNDGSAGIPGNLNDGRLGRVIEAEIAGTANEGTAGSVGNAGSSGSEGNAGIPGNLNAGGKAPVGKTQRLMLGSYNNGRTIIGGTGTKLVTSPCTMPKTAKCAAVAISFAVICGVDARFNTAAVIGAITTAAAGGTVTIPLCAPTTATGGDIQNASKPTDHAFANEAGVPAGSDKTAKNAFRMANVLAGVITTVPVPTIPAEAYDV